MANSFGVNAFQGGLHALGLQPTLHATMAGGVTFDIHVREGRYAGRAFHIGVQVPDTFPANPPTGPHVSPLIHSIASGGVHPTGGIHASPFGPDFHYWSRPYPTPWVAGKTPVATYINHIMRLLETQ